MSEDIELIPEAMPDNDTALAYLEQIELPELRRYIALDMARMVMCPSEKLVKIAGDIDRFLQGNYPRDASKQ